MNRTGYIQPIERTMAQRSFDDAMFSTMGFFSDRSEGYLDKLPNKALTIELENQLIGKPAPRIWQQTGSCVGSAAANAQVKSMVGDIIIDGQELEGRLMPFAWGAYGRGRELGGMNSKGEGSFGSVQAAASMQAEFGMLAYDDPRVPQPEIVIDELGGRWFKYTKQEEIDWSYAPEWPIPYEELRKDSSPQGFAKKTRIKSIEETQQAHAQGYGVTIAAGYLEGGKVRPTDGLLISEFNDRGGHQQGIGGYLNHPSQGLLFEIDNNWGPEAHGRDDILAPLGVLGSYWIRAERYEELLRDPQTEVFAVSSSGTWKTRPIAWDDVFSYYD